MSTQLVIAIDPGKAGGIAAGAVRGVRLVSAWPMPPTLHDQVDLLRKIQGWALKEPGGECFAYVEQVGTAPPGKKSARAMRLLTEHFGELKGILATLPISFEAVPSGRWQGAMDVRRPRGAPEETPTAKKNRHKAKAQELFPQLEITHAKADALLIMEYGRRLRLGPQPKKRKKR